LNGILQVVGQSQGQIPHATLDTQCSRYSYFKITVINYTLSHASVKKILENLNLLFRVTIKQADATVFTKIAFRGQLSLQQFCFAELSSEIRAMVVFDTHLI
jgi:hypothetical protein